MEIEGGTALVLGVGLGLGAWWLLSQKSRVAPTPARPAANDGTNLGMFGPVLKLPGLAQAYNVLAPIQRNFMAPIITEANKALEPVNDALAEVPGVKTYNNSIGPAISRALTNLNPF